LRIGDYLFLPIMMVGRRQKSQGIDWLQDETLNIIQC